MVTWDDFDKIWASTSPLTPYEFSDPNYSQGWNFIGSTPPARQMWDSIQKKNDEKFKYLRDNFGTPNIVTSSSQMTDTEKVYVYMGSEAGWNSGHWYYWDGSAWADGGVYNSVAFVTDTTLSIAGQPADAKAVGDALTLKADLAGCTFTGNVNVNADFSVTGDSTLTGNVSASGDVNATGDVTADNISATTNGTIGGALSVAGASTLTGNVSAGADITVVGDVSSANIIASNNAHIGGNATVTGSVASASLTTTADGTIGGNLSVSGTTALAGTSTAPTPSADDNSTKIATTEYVQTEIKPIETDVTINDKRITNIEKLLQGNLYDYQTDTTSSYTKTVPSGAMPYAGLEQIGGKTLVMNQLFSPMQRTYNGVTQTFDSQTGLISLSGTVTTSYFVNAFDIQFINGHKYCGILTVVSNPNNINFRISSLNLGGALVLTTSAPKVITTANQTKMSSIGLEYYGGAGVDFTGVSFKVVFSDITLMFGAGNEPSTVEEFEAIFPANFYSVNNGTLLSAGVTEVVSKGKNLIKEDRWYYNPSNFKYENGVFSNTAADTKTYFSYFLRYMNNGTNLGNATEQPTAVVGINTVTFTATVSCNTLMLGHNGSAVDFRLYFMPPGGIVKGKTYTFSMNVISNNPTVVGGLQFNHVMLEESATATNYVPYMTPIQYPIPAEIRNLEGYGWSAGSVYNYIDYERKVFVQNVGSRAYASGDESDSTVITDGTTTYYPLTTAVETDISEYLTDDNLINVESGGTLTFPNSNGTDYQIPVPSEETYMIDLQEAINNG